MGKTGEKPIPTLVEQRDTTLGELRAEHPNWVEYRRRMGRAAAQHIWNPHTQEYDWRSADQELNFKWHGSSHKVDRLLEELVTLEVLPLAPAEEAILANLEG